jgi:hypothetical protein
MWLENSVEYSERRKILLRIALKYSRNINKCYRAYWIELGVRWAS